MIQMNMLLIMLVIFQKKLSMIVFIILINMEKNLLLILKIT